jgi:hypothetical protein
MREKGLLVKGINKFVAVVLVAIIGVAAISVYSQTTYSQDEAMAKKMSESITGTTEINRVDLLVSVFTFNRTEETINLLKKYLIKEDYLIGPTFCRHLPDNRMILVGRSIDEIKEAVSLAQNSMCKVDLVVYDPEHWDETPYEEQQDIPTAISNASDIVHEAGLRFGVTPDLKFLKQNYQKIEWDKIDYANMQVQTIARNTIDLSLFTNTVQRIGDFIRHANPNTEIFAQLSFRYSDADRMIQVINGVKDSIDGFVILYLPNPVVTCTYCTIENLEKVLGEIASIRSSS